MMPATVKRGLVISGSGADWGATVSTCFKGYTRTLAVGIYISARVRGKAMLACCLLRPRNRCRTHEDSREPIIQPSHSDACDVAPVSCPSPQVLD